jgi:anti-sigma regulatory factor (Ser/Thr protein kinase)
MPPTGPPQLVVEAALAATEDAPAQARSLLRGVGDRLAGHTLDDGLLVVTELVTNAVRHGPRDGPIDLRILSDDAMRIEVSDLGTWTPAPAAPSGPGLPTGGWGLSIVNTLADDWGVDQVDGGTMVWAEVRPGGDAGRGDAARGYGAVST